MTSVLRQFRRQHPELQVELISADAQTKPDVAAAIAGAWFDRDGVDLVLDVPVSNCALAVASVARARNKAAIFNTSTSDLTGKSCSPNHVHWAFDTYALSASTARALLAEGGRSWFLIQADYTFGAVLAAEATAVVAAACWAPRIASPEMLPSAGLLPHLKCSPAGSVGSWDEAGEHDDTH